MDDSELRRLFEDLLEDNEVAFHTLRECPSSLSGLIVHHCRQIGNLYDRVRALEALRERRDSETLSFLFESLLSEEPEEWQCALDGIAANESRTAYAELKNVLELTTDPEKRMSILETLANWSGFDA